MMPPPRTNHTDDARPVLSSRRVAAADGRVSGGLLLFNPPMSARRSENSKRPRVFLKRAPVCGPSYLPQGSTRVLPCAYRALASSSAALIAFRACTHAAQPAQMMKANDCALGTLGSGYSDLQTADANSTSANA
eukprot:5000159-Pleurochrysis_carterae.AAC.3